MKLLNGHLEVTPKSLTTIAGGIVAIALAWGYLTPERAEAVSSFVAIVAALVVPARKDADEPASE